jgi:hypothetical protein
VLPCLVQDKQVTFDGVYLSLSSGLKTATTRNIMEDLLNEVERLATLRNAEVIVSAMQAELPAREVHYLVAPQFSKPDTGLRLTA